MSSRKPYYRSSDPDEMREWAVKAYACSEIIVETCLEHGFECERVRPDLQADFFVIQFKATFTEFKKARAEWLGRMFVGGPKLYEEAKASVKAQRQKCADAVKQEIDLLA